MPNSDPMNHSQRSTFLTNRQVIEHATKEVRGLADELARQQREAGDGRLDLYLQDLVAAERSLAEHLDEYMGDAPENVLDTYTQYTSDELSVEPAPEPRESGLAGLTVYLLSRHKALADTFEGISAHADTEEVREAFAALGDLMTGAAERIAKSSQSIHDV